MKSRFLLALLACCIGISSASAQCFASFSYSTSPTGGWVTFYVDSTINVNPSTTLYTWSFGDGTSGTSSQTAHQYNTLVSSYQVCLTLHDTSSGCSYTTCDTVNLGGGSACSATVAYSRVDSDYTFTASSTGTGPFTYSWTVNGQSASILASPTITLSPVNTYYTVCVNITDASGCTASTCAYVFDTVSNPSNTCSAYLSLTGQQDSTYTFTVSALNSGSSSYVWTYNNTTITGSSSASIVIDSASLALRPTICVAVTDGNGCVASDCLTLGGSATGGGCQAYFVIYPDSLNAAGQGYYTGINLSSGNYGQNVLWSFGDGNTSTSLYPSHTYSTPGQYTVCLTVGTPGTTCYDTYCDSSFYVFKTASGPMSHLSIQGPNGIHDIASEAQVTIYPNPATDVLTISTTDRIDEQRIYDIKGQLMIDIKANTSQINISKLSAGIYVLELNINGAFSRSKFVKE